MKEREKPHLGCYQQNNVREERERLEIYLNKRTLILGRKRENQRQSKLGKQKEVGEFREEEALNKEENLFAFFFFFLTVKQPKRRRFGNKREQITWICTFK